MTQTPGQPGAAIRAFRARMGLTLAEVSQRTNLAVSVLSKIENNRVSLNFDKLSRLSSGLGLDIASLLDPRPANKPAGAVTARRSVTRSNDETVIETNNYNHFYHATDLRNKSFTPIVADVRARSITEFGDLISHPGEEFAYVLEGVVELHTDIYTPVVLCQGDSVFFDSSMGHAYIAAAAGPCRILSISASPGQGQEAGLAAAASYRLEAELQPA